MYSNHLFFYRQFYVSWEFCYVYICYMFFSLITDMILVLSLQWNTIQMRLGTGGSVPVLQACAGRRRRTFLSLWMERKEAHNLLMDITFAQEEEPHGQLSPVHVHLFDSDTAIPRFQDSSTVLELQTSKPFPDHLPPNQISRYLNSSLALNLGSVDRRGFQLAFSYSGTCVFITSIRLYYRRCPDNVALLVSFGRTGAGSGSLRGTCVKGAVEVSPPVRECNFDGVWGPLQGECTCEIGHEVMDDTCQGMQTQHSSCFTYVLHNLAFMKTK